MSGEVWNSIARQRALWRISAALADAPLTAHEDTITGALARATKTLGVAGFSIYETDLIAKTTAQRHLWMVPDAPDGLRDEVARPLSEGVAEEMFANEGLVVLPIGELAGERVITPGWEDGVGVVALIDFTGVEALTLVVVTAAPAFDDEDLEFVRTLATILRQYYARVRTERDLEERLDLEAFVRRSVARLGTAAPETIGLLVDDCLHDVVERFGVDGATVYRVQPDRLVAQHVVGEPSAPIWHNIARPEARPFEIQTAEIRTMTREVIGRELLGTPPDAGDPPFATLVPSDVGSSVRETLVLSHDQREWDTAEREALALIGLAIAQTRVRVEAEVLSAYRHAVQAEFASIAAEFLRVEHHDVDAVVTDALRRVSRRLGAPLTVVFAVDGDTPGTGRVDALWCDGEPPYAPGDSVPHTRTNMADLLKAGEAWAGVLPLTDGLLPEFRALVTAAGQDSWTTVAAPLTGAREPSAVAVALAGDHGDRLDTLVELLSTFADLLAQLQVRLDLERSIEREAEAQALLRRAAAALTEMDDFDDAVRRVLAEVADFFDLDGLASWQVDEARGRYVVQHAIGSADGVGTTLDFGIDTNMDTAHGLNGPCCVDEPLHEVGTLTNFAIARGTDARRAVLTAFRAGTGIEPLGCRILDELSTLLDRMEERVVSARYSQSAFGDAPIGIVLCDEEWRIITCNPAFARFVGRDDPSELIGTPPDELLDTDDRHPEAGIHEMPLRRPDGQRLWVRSHSTAIEGVTGDEPMWLVHIEDITERRRADQLLRFQAEHDELTGLGNRRLLHTWCERFLDGEGSTAVLMLDLDRFKLINDSLGHDRGDELLIVVSDRLRLAVRPGDAVARLGGDEFAVVLGGPVSSYEAGVIAERLLRLLGEPVLLGSQTVYPSASIGIALAEDHSTVSEMLRQADTAMYRAKAAGRSRYELFDEDLRGEVQDRMETESGLRRALRSNEFVVHYQPEVCLRTGAVVGAEALVRWEHPVHGLLAPGAFLDVAEETGLIVDIGTHVLFEACHAAAAWPGDDLVIRVNFAAAQLQRAETVGLVEMALEQSGLDARRLCVEITESAMMGDVHQAETILQQIKGLGVRVAVDDFGTGFSSLAYLKRFPVDALKIDREFVSGLGRSDEDNAFVRSIVSLAEALGLSVVAEGVESADEADILLRLGCFRAQGFHFARPAPESALLEMVRSQVTS